MSSDNARAVFAVIRLDHYLRDVADLRDQFTVKEVLMTRDEAEEEAKRLNDLARAEGKTDDVEYVVHHTRLVGPAGSA